MDKYNLSDYNSYKRIAKIMNEKYSSFIENDPVLNHGKHDDIYSIFSALHKFHNHPVEDILLDEYELKLRNELLQQSIKLFNLEKELQILKLRQEVCQQIYSKMPYSHKRNKWKDKTISFYKEEEKKLKDNHSFILMLEHFLRLRKELRAVLEMKGVSFKEHDERLQELWEIERDKQIETAEYFSGGGFNGDI
ncbi:hypothetical protein PNU79_10885 [Turicibacter sanguinis]|uniref:hypothetical protein n=1 Tax=Turicibacter sanguinis TaxID=154288 RepID=UPI00232BE2A7|nr:hypothetical protein [Turicibacter sanguinis]MDB8542505.1 hypothetical protein [Turicibacter sanguinis]